MAGLPALQSAARDILGRTLTAAEVAKFSKYLKLLADWNAIHRLVGSTDREWAVANLLVDSLLFLRVLPTVFESILDLGSGAGLPGVPISIVRPEAKLTMIESRRRRASFLATVVRELPLEKASVIAERAESVVDDLCGEFDVAVVRCAGPLSEVLPLAARFVKPGGIVAAAGPPVPQPLSLGAWVTVQLPGMTTARRFAVHQVPAA